MQCLSIMKIVKSLGWKQLNSVVAERELGVQARSAAEGNIWIWLLKVSKILPGKPLEGKAFKAKGTSVQSIEGIWEIAWLE